MQPSSFRYYEYLDNNEFGDDKDRGKRSCGYTLASISANHGKSTPPTWSVTVELMDHDFATPDEAKSALVGHLKRMVGALEKPIDRMSNDGSFEHVRNG